MTSTCWRYDAIGYWYTIGRRCLMQLLRLLVACYMLTIRDTYLGHYCNYWRPLLVR